MPDHNYFASLIRQTGPYYPPQYEPVMLPMNVLRRFEGVLAPTEDKVLVASERRKGRLRAKSMRSADRPGPTEADEKLAELATNEDHVLHSALLGRN